MSLSLPSLEAFKQLTQPERAAVFIAWAATQPPEQLTDYWTTSACPLSRFGAALSGLPKCYGDGHGFVPGVDRSDLQAYLPRIERSEEHPEHVAVLSGQGGHQWAGGTEQAAVLQSAKTYGDLVRGLSEAAQSETANPL